MGWHGACGSIGDSGWCRGAEGSQWVLVLGRTVEAAMTPLQLAVPVLALDGMAQLRRLKGGLALDHGIHQQGPYGTPHWAHESAQSVACIPSGLHLP